MDNRSNSANYNWLAGQMPTLHEYYPGCGIYLIRNELDYFVFSPKDGLNNLDQTTDTSSIYGAGITVHEPAVKNWLDSNSYRIIKPIGLPFHNHDDKQLDIFTQSFRQNSLS